MITTEPIDLAAERDRRNADPEYTPRDDYGRPLVRAALEYEFDGKRWSAEIVAYDEADANARVVAMRDTLKCVGVLTGKELA